MKQIELELQKKILIVERQLYTGETPTTINIGLNRWDLDFICKGSELTEEVAFQLVKENSKHGTNTSFTNYKGGKSFFWAKESFISAIEAKGYYWSENPIEQPFVEKYGWYTANSQEEESGWMYEEGEDKYYEALKEWQEAESKTFNPAKTLIFEILL